MKTSLCILNDSIKVVCGKPSKKLVTVTDWTTLPLSEESVVNGVIVNDTPVRSALSQLHAKLGKPLDCASLIIDSNSILSKQVTVPYLPEKKLYSLVQSEFADVSESRGELLYDYMVVKQRNAANNGGVILCSAVEKSLIESYVSLLSDAGIKIESIDIAVSSLIRLSRTEKVGSKTCIVAVLNGNSISASLFVDGSFRFFNQARLFQDRATPASTSEIAQILSSLIQFNSAEKTGRDITHIYIAGLNKEEKKNSSDSDEFTRYLCDAISEMFSLECCEFPGASEFRAQTNSKKKVFPICDYIYCAGAFLAE